MAGKGGDLFIDLDRKLSDKTEIADKLHSLIWDLEKINNIK